MSGVSLNIGLGRCLLRYLPISQTIWVVVEGFDYFIIIILDS